VRVLCVTGYYKPAHVYGGPVRSISTLCESLTRGGISVTVLTTNANGKGQCLEAPIGRAVTVEGVQVEYYPALWPIAAWLPFYSPGLGKACRRLVPGYDVVYLPATWTYAMLAGARAAQEAGIPYIVSPRGSFMRWSMTQKSLKKRFYLALVERRLIDRAAAIHLTSAMEKEQQERWGFKPPAVIIPNGLDVERFEALPPAGALRRQLGIPPEASLALFVGRLHREKRINLIVEAFALVTKDVPNAPDEDGSGVHAKTQARRIGLADRIHFTGLLSGAELMQAYADADFLLLLSHRENFGMVVVEAMAAGLPVLLSQEVGLATEVEHARTGFVVTDRAEDVAGAWIRLASDPDLRHKMGNAGRQLVRSEFAAEVVATKMRGLFASVVSRHSGTR
jgi:glycosyltransferase involved in cell wall biosynthesis